MMLGESIIDERMERRFDVGDVGGLAEYYFNVWHDLSFMLEEERRGWRLK